MNTRLNLVSIICMMILLMGASNCSHSLKYESDEGYMAPYQAQALEFPVSINKKICKDMDNQVGACTKILSEREEIYFNIQPLAYNYNLRIVCSTQINFSYEADILSGREVGVQIPTENYKDVPEFICSGRITPQDRDFISSRFEVRFRVFDAQFVKRGHGYVFKNKGKYYLNMGKNAYYVYVYDNGEWKTYKKSPVIQVYDVNNLKAFSESEIMRMNFYNF